MIKMIGKDVLNGKQAECTIDINGRRYNLMMAKNVKLEYEKKKTEVPILGQMSNGNKAGGLKYKGSMTIYYVQSLFRELIYKYQETGEDFYFDVTITNEDPTSKAGRQTVTAKDCNIDSGVLAMLDIGAEMLEEDVSFTFEHFDLPEKFDKLTGFEL